MDNLNWAAIHAIDGAECATIPCWDALMNIQAFQAANPGLRLVKPKPWNESAIRALGVRPKLIPALADALDIDHAALIRMRGTPIIITQPYGAKSDWQARYDERLPSVLPDGIGWRFGDSAQSLYLPGHSQFILIGAPNALAAVNLDWRGNECACPRASNGARDAGDVLLAMRSRYLRMDGASETDAIYGVLSCAIAEIRDRQQAEALAV